MLQKDTLALMASKGLYPIFWTANSPDLNPIEDEGVATTLKDVQLSIEGQR